MCLHGASNNRTEMRATSSTAGADGPLPLKRVNKAYELDWVSTLSPTRRLPWGRYIEGNFGNIDSANSI